MFIKGFLNITPLYKIHDKYQFSIYKCLKISVFIFTLAKKQFLLIKSGIYSKFYLNLHPEF